MPHWRPSDIPSLAGKFAIVTGANSGIGRSAARELARAGAAVVLACRDVKKGETAAAGIRSAVVGAKVEVVPLDLASLQSVRDFAAGILARKTAVDILLNNAGVMMPPKRRTTADGFELQFGTNHLGHFALTGLLLPAILEAPAGRVIGVSSIAHKSGQIRFDDLQFTRKYSPWKAYAQSKLANLLFSLELDRRLRRAGAVAISVGAHPGVSVTNLVTNSTGGMRGAVMNIGFKIVGQSEDRGAFPLLLAATAPQVEGGKFYGPAGVMEYHGFPVEVRPAPQALDESTARNLWEVSEQLTKVKCEFPSTASAAHGWISNPAR